MKSARPTSRQKGRLRHALSRVLALSSAFALIAGCASFSPPATGIDTDLPFTDGPPGSLFSDGVMPGDAGPFGVKTTLDQGDDSNQVETSDGAQDLPLDAESGDILLLPRDGAAEDSGPLADGAIDNLAFDGVTPTDVDLFATQTDIDSGELQDLNDSTSADIGQSADLATADAETPPLGFRTYYVRPGGGTAQQCTGLSNADYPGSGFGKSCAVKHLFWLLPPGRAPLIAGGDTVIIASGSYRMGYNAPNAVAPYCDSAFPWDCTMAAIPSGPAADRPTRILGQGWDTGCANPPELFGVERTEAVINLDGSSNVELACLEITDHAGCVEFHPGALACPRDGYPYGDWAVAGIVAADSQRVTLRKLTIHGLAFAGIRAARLKDWTVDDLILRGNGWAGWFGDLQQAGLGNDNSGALIFRGLRVEWTGCAESYPGGAISGCFQHSLGDAFGVPGAGGDWRFEDAMIRNNASDGLQIGNLTTGSVTLRRVRVENNSWNQLHLSGHATIVNSVIVGHCAFFDGKPQNHNVEPCKDLGNTIIFTLFPGSQVQLVNNTISGQGDVLVQALPGSTCNGTERLLARNNIFVGQAQHKLYPNSPDDLTVLADVQACAGLIFDEDYGVVHNVKFGVCPGPNDLCQDPQLTDGSLETFDPQPLTNSPAVNSGLPPGGLVPWEDFGGVTRPQDGGTDRGAIELKGAP